MIVTYAKPTQPPQTEFGRPLARGPIFIALASYMEGSVLKDAGFVWSSDVLLFGDKRSGHWWTAEPAIAARLSAYCDEQAAPEIRRLVASRKASRSVDATVVFPSPDGKEYLPFQRAGIRYLRTRKNVLLADEMGLGKTIQAIGLLNSLDDRPEHVLVICPAGIKRNWMREIDRWDVHGLTVGIATGHIMPSYANVVIVNYDILARHSLYLQSVEWDVLIVDEAHMIKNPGTKRSQAVYGPESAAKGVPKSPGIRAKRKVFLTGTPIVNRPAELFPLIHYLDPERWTSKSKFEKRYVGWGNGGNGGTNLEELQDILRSTIMVRRLKSEVLTELPPKWRQIIELPATAEIRATIDAEMETFKQAAVARGVVLPAGSTDAEWMQAVMTLEGGEWAGFQDLAALRHITAVAKAPAVGEHVVALLEDTPKVVVYAHHRDVLNILEEKLAPYGVVRIDGGVKPELRQALVDSFQGSASARVFLGGITAAGVGITLTAANTVVFAELDWVPGNMKQAEDRLHRIGAEGHESILVQHMVLEGSMDVGMAEILCSKLETMERLLNQPRQLSSEESGADDVAIGSKMATSAVEGGSSRTWGDDDYRRAHVAGGIKQMEAVHEAIRFVMEAEKFGLSDRELGSSLSRWKGQLTPRQAAAGMKMLSRYSRVLPPQIYSRAVLGRD